MRSPDTIHHVGIGHDIGGADMDLNPISRLKGVALRRRTRRPAARRLTLVTTELTDAEAARLGRGTRLSEAEAERMHGFLRAGGGVVAHR
jgi:hypothetical protein